MNEENYEEVLLVLEKIARDTGEDEAGCIYHLENEFNLKIMEERVEPPLPLRPLLKLELIWVWVLKPYNPKEYETRREYLYSHILHRSYSVDKYVMRQKIDGKYYIKYPESAILSVVQEYIFEQLLEDYGIELSNFTKSEWEDIITSKQFKKAEIQVARELIANNLLSKYQQNLIISNDKNEGDSNEKY